MPNKTETEMKEHMKTHKHIFMQKNKTHKTQN